MTVLANERLDLRYAMKASGITLETVEKRVAELFAMAPRELYEPGRQKRLSDARSVFCFFAVRELGISMASLAERFAITGPAISYSVKKGGKIVRKEGWTLGRRGVNRFCTMSSGTPGCWDKSNLVFLERPLIGLVFLERPLIGPNWALATQGASSASFAVRELGISMTSLAEKFALTGPAISYSVKKGGKIVREEGWTLGGEGVNRFCTMSSGTPGVLR